MTTESGIRLEFAQFGHFDSFDVIRSMVSMASVADEDLPSPIASGLKTMYYVDADVVEGLTYYYRVRVWRGATSFVSDEVSVKTQLLDMLNNISLKIGSSSVSDIGFDQYIWTQPVGAIYSEGLELDLISATSGMIADKVFDFTLPWVFKCEFKVPITSSLGYLELLRNSGDWRSGSLQISFGNTLNGDSYNKIFVGIYGAGSLATPVLARNTYHTLQVNYLGSRQFRVFINDVEVLYGTHKATHVAGIPRVGRGFSLRKLTLRRV
ncbi:hypothetical protein [Acinetobacter sp. 102]|uniref:hypothetical protein n=1 Tax=Acinetobacter sp. 102 TaxID=3098766 RepID=UPI00300AB3E5